MDTTCCCLGGITHRPSTTTTTVTVHRSPTTSKQQRAKLFLPFLFKVQSTKYMTYYASQWQWQWRWHCDDDDNKVKFKLDAWFQLLQACCCSYALCTMCAVHCARCTRMRTRTTHICRIIAILFALYIEVCVCAPSSVLYLRSPRIFYCRRQTHAHEKAKSK